MANYKLSYEARQGLKKIETGSHIVFYFNKQQHTFVVRVLHKSMDGYSKALMKC